VRIISGKFKGYHLKSCAKNLRPTTDRVKESLFGIIRGRLPDAKILDLFAGSGSLGLEAISEGAKSCSFVDKSYKSVSGIKSNCKNLDVENITKIHNCSSTKFINKISQEPFDIIFIDPPYKNNLISKVVNRIFKAGILNKNGFIVAESHSNEKINIDFGKIVRTENYGDTKLTFINE